MTTTIFTARGPFEHMNRAEMETYGVPPRRSTPPVVDASRLCGVTPHYSGGSIRSDYVDLLGRPRPVREGDLRAAARAVRNHLARKTASGAYSHSDVGYNLLIGRSGLVMDGRGVLAMNGANGSLMLDGTSTPNPNLKAVREGWFPPLTSTTNPHYVSLYLCVGTNEGYDNVTPEQEHSLRLVVAWLVDEVFLIPRPHPRWPKAALECGHRDVRATACPGDNAYRLVGKLYQPLCRPFDPDKRLWGNYPYVAKGTIAEGSSGQLVRYLDGVLRAAGYTVGDGSLFDERTGNAVAAVQKSNRLPVDRVVGASTWAVVDTVAKRLAPG